MFNSFLIAIIVQQKGIISLKPQQQIACCFI